MIILAYEPHLGNILQVSENTFLKTQELRKLVFQSAHIREIYIFQSYYGPQAENKIKRKEYVSKGSLPYLTKKENNNET